MKENNDFERLDLDLPVSGNPTTPTDAEGTASPIEQAAAPEATVSASNQAAAPTFNDAAAPTFNDAAVSASAEATPKEDGIYHYTREQLPYTPTQPSYGENVPQGTPYTGPAQPQYQTPPQTERHSPYPGSGPYAGSSPYARNSSSAGSAPVYSHMFADGKPPKPQKSGRRVSGFTVALCVVLSLLCGFGGAALAQLVLPGSNGGSGNSVLYESVDRTGTTDDGSATRSSVVEMTQNSVVEIVTETRTTSSFFSQYVTQGAGSGVIVTTDGYIVTNNHVVSGGSSIKVVVGQTEYPATLVGTDATSDLAVIKIDATGLTPAVFGSSDNVRVGDAVIAIGNPLGSLGGSVTDGIVSALERTIQVGGQEMTLLQTNAAVNPGNSGGGLFNMNGELIGIVNAKTSASSTSTTTIEGIGFAIPVDTVKQVTTAILENGYVTGQVIMGIQVIQINTAEAAAQYGVDRMGVYIASVDEGLGAEAAGLQAGDFILSVEDQLIEKTSDVTSLLKNYEVGDHITLQVIRQGNLMTFEVELSERKG